MALEIERKFLVINDDWRARATGSIRLRQGYLTASPDCGRASVRVRVDGKQGYLNIKSVTLGIHRHEFEYVIPLDEANEMLDTLTSGPIIDKTRYLVPNGRHVWEVDEFHGDNEGLIVAEIELSSLDEPFEVPDWAGADVSDDPRYYNISLAQHPYSRWTHAVGRAEWDERDY
ncbi:MAG: CYTH domain-containing protein [Gammaproteobacteria bacterium]|nr:CYTH domain-containing protein [Gammaproteobacteria bacterium]